MRTVRCPCLFSVSASTAWSLLARNGSEHSRVACVRACMCDAPVLHACASMHGSCACTPLLSKCRVPSAADPAYLPLHPPQPATQEQSQHRGSSREFDAADCCFAFVQPPHAGSFRLGHRSLARFLFVCVWCLVALEMLLCFGHSRLQLALDLIPRRTPILLVLHLRIMCTQSVHRPCRPHLRTRAHSLTAARMHDRPADRSGADQECAKSASESAEAHRAQSALEWTPRAGRVGHLRPKRANFRLDLGDVDGGRGREVVPAPPAVAADLPYEGHRGGRSCIAVCRSPQTG